MLKYLDNAGNTIGMDLFDRHADSNETNSLAKNPEYKAIIAKLEQSLKDEMKAIAMSEDHLPGRFSPTAGKPKVKKSSPDGQKNNKSKKSKHDKK